MATNGARDAGGGSQRDRLVAAAGRAVAERGAAAVTVTQIAEYAAVPDEGFFEHFTDVEEALTRVTDAFFSRLIAEVTEICDGGEDWPVRVEAALAGVLSFIAEAHSLSRALIVESGSIGLAATERQYAALDRFAELLRHGRQLYPRAASLPGPTERTLVGGIASIVAAHLLAEEPRGLVSLQSSLVELTLSPYVGEVEARRFARA